MRYLPGFISLAIFIAVFVFYFLPHRPWARTTAAATGPLPDGLTIRRIRSNADAFKPYRVKIDGHEVAQVKNGKSVTVDVPPGEHRLDIEIDPMYTRLDFTMTEEPKQVIVGRGLAVGGNAFTLPVILEA